MQKNYIERLQEDNQSDILKKESDISTFEDQKTTAVDSLTSYHSDIENIDAVNLLLRIKFNKKF